MSNNLRTVLLLGALTALVVGVAWLFGIPLWGGLAAAAAVNFSAYWFSDKMALRAARAKPVKERQMPEVYRIVRELTHEQGMPMPSIHRIKSQQANAFATGRNPSHAAVAVTDGIMDLLDERELRGVLGHELSHVKNRDILISSIAAVLGAALSFFVSRAAWSGKSNSGWLIPAIVFTPFAAAVLRSGVSKTREFEADHDGGELTTDPLALASALERIEEGARRFPLRINAAVGGLFVSDPLLGFGAGGLRSMLSTHPPTSERVARLESLADERGWDVEPERNPPRTRRPGGGDDHE
jgi:heat shock protein HtpX